MNTQNTVLSAEETKELDGLLEKLPQASLPGCKQYEEYKPYLVLALPIIGKLPFGSKIVIVLKFLMAVADTACGITPSASTSTQSRPA